MDTSPQDEIFDIAMSLRNDPTLLLQIVDELARWLQVATAGDVWLPGPFPEFGKVIPGQLFQPDLYFRLKALKCLARFSNDDGLSATIDLDLIDELLQGYVRSMREMQYDSDSRLVTAGQILNRQFQDMRLEVRIWVASQERAVGVGKRSEQLRASIERFQDARIVRTDEGVAAKIEGEGCSLLDHFWKSREHLVTTHAFEGLTSDPNKFGTSVAALRKRKDRLNDSFTDACVPIEIVSLKGIGWKMIRNSG